MSISLKRATGERIVPVNVSLPNDQGQVVEETLSVRFRPITPAWMEQRGNLGEEQSKDDLVSSLTEIVTDLDIRDEGGQAVPVTKELLQSLDFKFLSAVAEAIRAYTFPNVNA
ncbi:MAG TPA: hypothetical protein VEF04_22500 [Blastocatellia bacterium]|nr:hypothetical protein [Blastocatellia bacterium]